MKQIARFAAGLAVTLVTAATAHAAAEPPVVVELFTSQGCSSCPAAEAFMRDLAKVPGVVGLEFHVDYWDTLSTWSGTWKDPFSSPANTRRQQVYNAAIRRQNGVYTPQMVIDGRFEALGSRRGDVRAAMAQAATAPKLAVSVGGDGRLTATVSGESAAGEVFLARYLKGATTEVEKGENHGRTLASSHIVTAFTKIGEWKGGKADYALPAGVTDPKNGCAVVVQSPNQGAILGAAVCP